MQKIFMTLIVTLIVAGCVSTKTPLDRQAVMQPAASAPNRLAPDAPYTPYRPATMAANTHDQAAGTQTATQYDTAQGHISTQQSATDFQSITIGDNTHHNTSYNRYTGSQQTGNHHQATQNSYREAGHQHHNTAAQLAEQPAIPVFPPLKVAILLPLTGPHGDLGQSMLQAAQMALFDMGYNEFELMPRDTEGEPQKAASAAQAAINEGAQLIMGPLFSEEVKAVKPAARRYNVNMLSFSTDWTLAGDNTFIMGFLPFTQVQRVTEYAINNGYPDIAILAPNTDYGNAIIAAYNSLAYRNKLSTAKFKRYTPGSNDSAAIIREFTDYDYRVQQLQTTRTALETRLNRNPQDADALSQLAALDNANSLPHTNFSAVLLPTGGDEARSLANMFSYYDLGPQTLKRLGTGLWDDPGLATEPALQNAWFAASEPALRQDFENRYRELFGLRPQRLASLAYDATALAVVLAKNSYYTRGAIRFDRADFLNPNGFSGIDGIFRFRPDGMIERGLAVLEFKDSRIEVIDPAPRTFQTQPLAHTASATGKQF